MLERLENQKKLTANQRKIIVTANIGYVLAHILGDWQLTYGQSVLILALAGLGAVPGALFWGCIGQYMAEIWPNRLHGSGMGFGYSIGNSGRIVGTLALAVIVGSSNYVSPQVTLDAISPAFMFLSYWYAQAALAFLLLGIETKGRSIEEIGPMLDGGINQNSRGQVASTSPPGGFNGRRTLIIGWV
jgi:hypothetical protein